MPSLHPLSTSALSSPPFSGVEPWVPLVPVTPGTRLARWIERMHTRVIPRLLNEINTSNDEIVLIRRAYGTPVGDPLGQTVSTSPQTIRAVLSGPSATNLASGLLAVSDYECLVAAADIPLGVTVKDAIQMNGVTYSIVMLKPIPVRPRPVAFRLGLKRV